MKADSKWASLALAGALGLVASFTACSRDKAAAVPKVEPLPYWESEIPRGPAYPPGTTVEWPIEDADAGASLIGPTGGGATEDGGAERGGTTDKLLWQDVPLPPAPAAQEPHRELQKTAPEDGGIGDAGEDASPVESR